MKHGNVYWEIEMDFAACENPVYCNKTRIIVGRYEFKDAWNEACAIYDLQKDVLENKVTNFALRLRFDTSGPHAFEVLQTWWLQSPDKIDEFFEDIKSAFNVLRRI